MTTVFVVTEDEADFGQLILGVTSTLEAAAALAEADTRTPLEWRLPGRGAPGFYARVSPSRTYDVTPHEVDEGVTT